MGQNLLVCRKCIFLSYRLRPDSLCHHMRLKGVMICSILLCTIPVFLAHILLSCLLWKVCTDFLRSSGDSFQTAVEQRNLYWTSSCLSRRSLNCHLEIAIFKSRLHFGFILGDASHGIMKSCWFLCCRRLWCLSQLSNNSILSLKLEMPSRFGQ